MQDLLDNVNQQIFENRSSSQIGQSRSLVNSAHKLKPKSVFQSRGPGHAEGQEGNGKMRSYPKDSNEEETSALGFDT